jgi:hypothetical protein
MTTRSATDVRRLAEAVNGKRDLDVIVATDQHGDLVTRTALLPGDTYLFMVRTESRQLRAPSVGRLQLAGVDIELEGCDSVFWTEAAVEKFVWPYYEAHGIDVKRMRQAYESDSAIVAVAHLMPTIPMFVVATVGSIQLLTWEQYSQEQEL